MALQPGQLGLRRRRATRPGRVGVELLRHSAIVGAARPAEAVVERVEDTSAGRAGGVEGRQQGRTGLGPEAAQILGGVAESPVDARGGEVARVGAVAVAAGGVNHLLRRVRGKGGTGHLDAEAAEAVVAALRALLEVGDRSAEADLVSGQEVGGGRDAAGIDGAGGGDGEPEEVLGEEVGAWRAGICGGGDQLRLGAGDRVLVYRGLARGAPAGGEDAAAPIGVERATVEAFRRDRRQQAAVRRVGEQTVPSRSEVRCDQDVTHGIGGQAAAGEAVDRLRPLPADRLPVGAGT